MVACAFARGCARVLICALAMGAAEVAAQEAPAAKEGEPAPVSAEPAPAKAEEEAKKKPAAASSALPDMIVEASPKPAKKKVKAVAKPKAGAVVVADPSAEAEQPDPVTLGQSLSDTGTTVLSGDNARARTTGGGDANSFVRNLPNVQYQDDTSEDAGMTPEKEIDTRPMQFSIMGARTYENNIILNGVSINTNTGPVEDGENMMAAFSLSPMSFTACIPRRSTYRWSSWTKRRSSTATRLPSTATSWAAR